MTDHEPPGTPAREGTASRIREIRELAEEIVRSGRTTPEQLTAKLSKLSLREQAQLALHLPAARRLDLVLHAPKTMRLVRALPDADHYLTVREIGPADALPLLHHASVSQLRHLFDLEGWRADRFDARRTGAWVALLLESGEPAIRRFLRHVDDEVLMLLCRSWMRIEQILYEDRPDVHGHGEGESGTEQGFMTPDGYHRFSPTIPEHAPAIRMILQLFYTEDPERYQRIIWDSRHMLLSELEEQALHWRQSRLEEHGFPPRDEALSVYAPPLGVATHPVPPWGEEIDGVGVSAGPLMLQLGRDAVVQAVDQLPEPTQERVLHELLSLANHLLVADGGDTGDPEAHRAVLQKSVSFLNIALAARGALDTGTAAALLDNVPLIELFREGWSQIIELQTRTRELLRDGWPNHDREALGRLDSPLRDRLRALLEPRPRYAAVDPDDQTVELREFRTPAEIAQTRVALEMGVVVGNLLLQRLQLESEQQNSDAPLSTLLRTLLAWHASRGELRGDPLPPEVVSDFLRTVASRRTASPEAMEWALEQLLRKLNERLGLNEREHSLIRAFGRASLEQLSAECATLDPGVPPDPRHVRCLLLRR